MKLSEAIRLGAMGLPPTKHGDGLLFKYDGAKEPCAACAIGAAAWAVGLHNDHSAWFGDAILNNTGPLLERFPILAGAAEPSLLTLINWKFERDGWTREAIADWVETLEQQQEQQAPLRVTELAEVV